MERLVLEWESSGFDPAEIEYVVGDVEKRSGGDAGNADAVSAFRRQGFVAKHVDRRHQAVQGCPDLVTHHGDEMPAGALSRVHEVVRALELLERRLVTGNGLGQLGLPGAEGLFAHLYGPPQARDVVANRVEALSMQGDVTAQSLTLMSSGRHTPRHAHAHHADSRDRHVNSSGQKGRA
jgi:hypothetical protein